MCCLVCIFLLMFVSNHLSGAKRIHRRLQLLWTCLGGGDGYVRPWIPQSEVSGEKRHLRQKKQTKNKNKSHLQHETNDKDLSFLFLSPSSAVSPEDPQRPDSLHLHRGGPLCAAQLRKVRQRREAGDAQTAPGHQQMCALPLRDGSARGKLCPLKMHVWERTTYFHWSYWWDTKRDTHLSPLVLQEDVSTVTETWMRDTLCTSYTFDRLFSFSILTARVFALGDPTRHTDGSAQKCL